MIRYVWQWWVECGGDIWCSLKSVNYVDVGDVRDVEMGTVGCTRTWEARRSPERTHMLQPRGEQLALVYTKLTSATNSLSSCTSNTTARGSSQRTTEFHWRSTSFSALIVLHAAQRLDVSSTILGQHAPLESWVLMRLSHLNTSATIVSLQCAPLSPVQEKKVPNYSSPWRVSPPTGLSFRVYVKPLL